VVGEEASGARAALGPVVMMRDGFLDTAQLVENLAVESLMPACLGCFLDLVCEPELFRTVPGDSHGEHLGDPGVVGDPVDAGGELLASAAGLPAGKSFGQLVQATGDLSQGLIESAALGSVQGRLTRDDDPWLLPVNRFRAFARLQPGKSLDGLVVAGRDQQEVLVVRGRSRADILRASSGQVGEVVGAVLTGIEDHGQRVVSGAGYDRLPTGGDGPVTWIRVPRQRNTAITGDDQPETELAADRSVSASTGPTLRAVRPRWSNPPKSRSSPYPTPLRRYPSRIRPRSSR
jgi:hypothetical protein